MSKILKVGHYQCECAPGDYEKNIAKVIHGLEFAEKNQRDIMVFPESFLTGYFAAAEPFKKHSWPLDGPEVADFLKRVEKFTPTILVGLNEKKDGKIYNTVIVVENGKIIGAYRKAFPCSVHETPGREFPVFEKNGIKYGIVICADGGYIEPARILALKGAKIIFAPHYNYIKTKCLLGHFMKVRADHTARAVENGIWFMRCNNVNLGPDKGLNCEGIGYGDSYLIDPNGEIIVRSRRHQEYFLTAEIDCDMKDIWGMPDYLRRTRNSARELLPQLREALEEAEKNKTD